MAAPAYISCTRRALRTTYTHVRTRATHARLITTGVRPGPARADRANDRSHPVVAHVSVRTGGPIPKGAKLKSATVRRARAGPVDAT